MQMQNKWRCTEHKVTKGKVLKAKFPPTDDLMEAEVEGRSKEKRRNDLEVLNVMEIINA